MANPSEFGQRLGQAIAGAGQSIGEGMRQRYLKEWEVAQQKAKEAEAKAKYVAELHTNYAMSKLNLTPDVALKYGEVGGAAGVEQLKTMPYQFQTEKDRFFLGKVSAGEEYKKQQEQLGQLKTSGEIRETAAKTKKLEAEAGGGMDRLNPEEVKFYSKELKIPENIASTMSKKSAENSYGKKLQRESRMGYTIEILRDKITGWPIGLKVIGETGKPEYKEKPGTQKVLSNLSNLRSVKANFIKLYKLAYELDPVKSGLAVPIKGGWEYLKKLVHKNPKANALVEQAETFLSSVNRSIGDDVGNIAVEEAKRAKGNLATIWNSKEELDEKFDFLDGMVQSKFDSIENWLKSAYPEIDTDVDTFSKSEQKSTGLLDKIQAIKAKRGK